MGCYIDENENEICEEDEQEEEHHEEEHNDWDAQEDYEENGRRIRKYTEGDTDYFEDVGEWDSGGGGGGDSGGGDDDEDEVTRGARLMQRARDQMDFGGGARSGGSRGGSGRRSGGGGGRGGLSLSEQLKIIETQFGLEKPFREAERDQRWRELDQKEKALQLDIEHTWKEYEFDRERFNRQLGWEQERFGREFGLQEREFGLDTERFGFEQRRWGEEFGFEKTRWGEERQLRERALALDEITRRAELSGYLDGNLTEEARRNRVIEGLQTGELTGWFGGQRTDASEQWRTQAALDYARTQAQLASTPSNWWASHQYAQAGRPAIDEEFLDPTVAAQITEATGGGAQDSATFTPTTDTNTRPAVDGPTPDVFAQFATQAGGLSPEQRMAAMRQSFTGGAGAWAPGSLEDMSPTQRQLLAGGLRASGIDTEDWEDEYKKTRFSNNVSGAAV